MEHQYPLTLLDDYPLVFIVFRVSVLPAQELHRALHVAIVQVLLFISRPLHVAVLVEPQCSLPTLPFALRANFFASFSQFPFYFKLLLVRPLHESHAMQRQHLLLPVIHVMQRLLHLLFHQCRHHILELHQLTIIQLYRQHLHHGPLHHL